MLIGGGGLFVKLLVPSLHRHVPQIVPNVLRLKEFDISDKDPIQKLIEIMKKKKKRNYSAVSGSVNVILSVSHNTEHSRNDSQRQHRFHPSQVHLLLSSFFSSSSSLFLLTSPFSYFSLLIGPRSSPKPSVSFLGLEWAFSIIGQIFPSPNGMVKILVYP